MHVWIQPAGIVQRSGLNRHPTRTPLGFVVYPRAALRAERAKLGSTGIGFGRKDSWFALGEPKVSLINDQGHAKRATGLALAIGAMANNELQGGPHHFIANLTALTTARMFVSHDFNPPGVWVPLCTNDWC